MFYGSYRCTLNTAFSQGTDTDDHFSPYPAADSTYRRINSNVPVSTPTTDVRNAVVDPEKRILVLNRIFRQEIKFMEQMY